MTMGRVQLYANTGKLIYDSKGAHSDERRLDRIKNEYDRGVAFYANPEEGIVRGQVKINRHGPEQFIAAYATESPEDLITEFVDAVTRAVDEQGWSIHRGAGGNQAVFDAFQSGRAFSSENFERIREQFNQGPVTIERLRYEIESNPPVTLIVPDYQTAAVTMGFLIRDSEQAYSFAISESTEVDTIQKCDVFLRPSRRVDAVTPGEEFLTRLQRELSRVARDRVEAGIRELVGIIQSRGDSPDKVLPGTINSLNVRRRVGFVLGPEKEGMGRWSGVLKWVITAWLFSFLTAYLLTLAVPDIAFEIVVIVTGVVVIIGAVLLGFGAWMIRGWRPLFEKGMGGKISSIDEDIIKKSEALVEELERFREATTGETFRKHLDRTFAMYGIKLFNKEEMFRRSIMNQLLGIIIGMLMGVVTFLLIG